MDNLIENIKKAISDLRPSLQADGGDINFVEIDENKVVKVKLIGACCGCPHAQITLKNHVEEYIKKIVPEISSVESV